MPFCPNCRAEYYPGIRDCADCGVPLVAALPVARDLAREDSEAICAIDSETEGRAIVADLARDGIGAMVANGEVRVLTGDVERAMPLLEQYFTAAAGPEDTEAGGADLADEDLVSVYEPPDQFLAAAVESLLRHEGIGATVQSRQMPMYDGLALMQHPAWGKVLVLKRDEQRARPIVEAFLGATAELDSPDPPLVCPSCGTELRRAAADCDRCGARIAGNEKPSRRDAGRS